MKAKKKTSKKLKTFPTNQITFVNDLPATITSGTDCVIELSGLHGPIVNLKCPLCKQWFNKVDNSCDFATIEKDGCCQGCRPIVYWQVYEQYPTDGGDIERFIVIRETEEDAKKVVEVLTQTDVLWSCYGYKKVVIAKEQKQSIWNRICSLWQRIKDLV